MTIVVICQFCRTRYRFRDDAAGQRITCELCGDVIAVPAAGGTSVSLEHQARFDEELGTARRHEPPRPIDPDRRDRPIDPTRPAVSDSMFKVGIGLRLVLLDALCSGLIYAFLTLGPVFLPPPQWIGPWWFRGLAGMQWLWVLIMATGMVGRLLCLMVPAESQAKPYIFSSVLLEFFFLIVTVADVSGEFGVPTEARLAGQICQLLGHVLFLGYLRRLAAYLRREDLYTVTQRAFAWGAVLVVAAVAAGIARLFFRLQVAQLFFLANFLAGPFVFFSYLRLLNRFHRAVRDLQ